MAQHDMDSAELRDQQSGTSLLSPGAVVTEADCAPEDPAFMDFSDQILAWLTAQPGITNAEQVGDGIFGFVLAGVGNMSMEINPTP